MQIKIDFLYEHQHLIPIIVRHFEAEWGEYYGLEGPGDALDDVSSLCNISEIPICLLAMEQNSFCGAVALRKTSVSHQHLSPWVTSFYVVPDCRRRGVGAKLIHAIERVALDFGISTIYAASTTAIEYFRKKQWDVIDFKAGDSLAIFKKEL